ncbi:hypothetical protein HYPSUDRAFT_70176 [Hypholoma sublateritium FD-334 SS-4]|uniref:Tetratricopeptide repeat protein n=1 Tax=Hypholoma sublateritium (strain FD-334 SS-4) TaxID=945553 RepID=A0A0D2KU78_HYPSF|nr:hypothetical protein HYPSUDRAFT_70176 [Hypholoma sublateritium FD-334 SS-4]
MEKSASKSEEPSSNVTATSPRLTVSGSPGSTNQLDMYLKLGMYKQAEEVMDEALKAVKWVPWFLLSDSREKGQIVLSRILSARGKFAEATKAIEKSCQKSAATADVALWRSALGCRANIALSTGDKVVARIYYQQAYDSRELPLKNPKSDVEQRVTVNCTINALTGLSEVLRYESPAESAQLLQKAMDLENTLSGPAHFACLSLQSVRAADDQDFEGARQIMLKTGSTGTTESRLLYISARTELLAGNYAESRLLFLEAIALSDDGVRLKARCLRALGEIALLQKDQLRANQYFAKTMSACNSMGLIHPRFLYSLSFAAKFDDAAFPGWKSFYESHYPEK